ncbi:MAG: PilZ domain-containing protein [Terriglobales bacterium]
MSSGPTTGVPATLSKKAIATVALIGLDEAASTILRDCFKQFGIQTTTVGEDVIQRLKREKFEACVLRLHEPGTEAILEAARTSSSNRRIVVYGICSNAQEALRFSRYGINAVLADPVERQSALRVVRATHLLVIHELRRYVRIPIVTEVVITVQGRKHAATSMEVSAGGMSLKAQFRAAPPTAVEVEFTLPDSHHLAVGATVCWQRDPDLLGVRFEASDKRRLAVKSWIDDYLGLA